MAHFGVVLMPFNQPGRSPEFRCSSGYAPVMFWRTLDDVPSAQLRRLVVMADEAMGFMSGLVTVGTRGKRARKLNNSEQSSPETR